MFALIPIGAISVYEREATNMITKNQAIAELIQYYFQQADADCVHCSRPLTAPNGGRRLCSTPLVQFCESRYEREATND